MIEIKPLTERTLSEAEYVVRECFPCTALAILRKVMRNPMRKKCAEAGDVAYEDGRPVAFQAFLGREMFLGRMAVRGNVGGMTGSVTGIRRRRTVAGRRETSHLPPDRAFYGQTLNRDRCHVLNFFSFRDKANQPVKLYFEIGRK